MTIGIDIDNVICNTTQSVLNVHYLNTGEYLTLEDIHSYFMEQYVSKEYQDDFHLIFLDKRVWKGIDILPNCVKTIEQLYNLGHEIYFITATEAANLHKKYQFLCRTFPFLNIRKRLINTQNKQLINCDILIDDYEQNLIGGNYYGILFNYPWNYNFDDAEYDNIFRVNDWSEVEPVITFIRQIKGDINNDP